MIFKQIDSSVDKTRKTLALFNKDWNTYKSNWQNANGLFGKIGSIFSSSKVTSNNIISNNQLQILRNWNNAVKHGCTNQETFNRIIADADENTKMYFAGLNKGKGSVEGLKNAQNTAETSTIGLTIAQTALNTAINMGIGLAISYAIKGISKLINYQKELIDKSQEAISVFEESRDALTNNKQTIDEISSDYTRLAQGVDSLGRNVSLNTEEYTRYNEIVNQIADMFPQMVQGYTDEGNAIIINKGNVEELTKAYEEQKKAYQDLVITKSADTFAGYKAKVAETPWTESLKGKNGTYAYIEQKKYIDELIKSLEDGEQAFENFYSNQYIKNSDIYNVLNSATKTAGIDWGGVMDTDKRYEQMKSQMTKLYAYQRQLISNINTETSKIKPIMSAYMGQSYDYQSLDSDVQDVVKQIVGQFDSEFYTQFDNETDMATWVTENIVNKFKGIDGEKITEAFKNSIDLKTKLQNGEISLDDYLSGINEFKMLIDGFDDNTKKSVDLIFNVNSSNGLSTDTLINNVKEKLQDDFDDKVGELTLEELHIAAEQVEVPEGTLLTWDELIAKIKEVQSSTSNFETPTPLSISQTIDQLNTQLKPAFDSLKSAYQDIFTDDGKFALNSIDILSTCDTIKSKLDEMSDPEGLNLDVDYSAFEDFVRVLNNTESTEQDVENAFDSLATSITQAALTGAEDFETMKSALEDLGVVNNEMVAFDALASNTEALKEAGLDLANATYEEIEAFAQGMVSAENYGQAVNLLKIQKILCAENPLDTSGDIMNLYLLANAAGIATDAILKLMRLNASYQKASMEGNTLAGIVAKGQMEVVKQTVINQFAHIGDNVDFSGVTKAAGKAGKDAGKTLKDALKEELSDLDSVISGITGRIDDQISSINEQKSAALESIDAQKEALEEAKDAAVEALEAERDARLEVIETQKKQLEEQIKLIDKQIKAKQDEIDAINDAADARKRELDLQKAQYELERMQNQRTILQYSEDKGMHYVNDTKCIRDAKEAVDDAKRQIEIANIQKEIDLLEDQKDLLNEQIDLLDERADAINKYYDEQIKQTEKFYDAQIKALEKQRKSTESYFESIIKNLENSKSKFQELTEILEKAELSAKLKQLGIDEEALLNGSEEEFNKLKDAYMNIVTQLNSGNDEVLSSLRELSGYDGTAPAMLENSNTELNTMKGNLDTSNQSIGSVNSSLDETATKTSDVATNLGSLTTNLAEVSSIITKEQAAFDVLRQKIDEIVTAINVKITTTQTGQTATAIATTTETACYMLLKEKILEVKESLALINNTIATLDTTSVNNLTSAFQALYFQLLLVSIALGAGLEGTAGGITSAIQSLNEISLEEGIIAKVSNLNTNLSETNRLITEEQTSFNNLKEKIDEVISKIREKTSAIQEEQQIVGGAVSSEMADFLLLKGKIDEVQQSIGSIGDTINQLDSSAILKLLDAFQLLYNKLILISITLGAGIEGAEEGAVGGITSAIQALNKISMEKGIITQFNNLKAAIDGVVSAISGGGASGDSASGSSGEGKESGTGGSAGGLVGAIEDIKSATDKALGGGGGEGSGGEDGEGKGSEGGGTGAIGQFEQLKTAVDNVTTSIGSEGNEGTEGENSDTLIGSIDDLGESVTDTLGEPGGEGAIGRFEKFKEPIQEAETHVKGIYKGLKDIDGEEVECTIKVNIELSGSTGFTGSAKVLGSMNLNSAEYNAKYTGASHAEGTAMVSGNWAVQSDEQNALVGEVGRELIVRGGRFFTVGDNGAEMFDIKKGDIVFNHEQTEDLLKHGHISGRGKAYADGTVGGGKIVTKDGSILRPLQPGDKMYDLVQKFDAYFKSMDGNLEKLVPNSFYEHQRQMEDMAKQINYVSSITNNNRNVHPLINGGINITCPGITSQEVARQVGVELDNMFNGMHLDAEQRSRMR